MEKLKREFSHFLTCFDIKFEYLDMCYLCLITLLVKNLVRVMGVQERELNSVIKV